MKKPLLLFLVIATLLGCKSPAIKETATSTISPVPYVTPAGDKIIFLDDYYTDYLKGIKAGCKNVDSLYMARVHNPIINNYFTKSEYLEEVKPFFPLPSGNKDTAGFGLYIAAVETNKAKIEELIIHALVKSRTYLKNDSLTVYVKPANAGWKAILQKMGGVNGLTPGSKQIIVIVDPQISSWNEMLEPCIAHEYNHAYWTKMYFAQSNDWSLLSYLVFEGRADSYARLLYPKAVFPWDSALTDKEKTDLWNEIKPELLNSDFKLNTDVMFGGNGYPIWGGYTLGYSIVQSAIKNNPKLSPAELSALSSEKILEMSDYKTTQ
jgi:uncharacterized protein YjaZ